MGKSPVLQNYKITGIQKFYKIDARWEGHAFTGHNSPLYARPDELEESSPGNC